MLRSRPSGVRSRLAPVAVVVVTAIAGSTACGGEDEAAPAPTPPTADTTPAATAVTTSAAPATTRPMSNVVPPTLGPPSGPPKTPTDATRQITLRGQVEAGIADGCVELVTPGGRFVLLGDLPAEVVAGATIEIDARAAPNVRTACDGTPVRVVAVRPG